MQKTAVKTAPTRFNAAQLIEMASPTTRATPEISDVNDFYGHAHVLKRFSGFSPDAPLNAIIEHGPYIARSTWTKELLGPGNAILVFSERRKRFVKSKSDKRVIAVGPILSYAEPSLDDVEIARERERLGVNVLLFPVHSTNCIAYKHDRADFLDSVKERMGGVDAIRVCLGWKNVLDGEADFYMRNGCEVVTAGHLHDPLFLPRLKSYLAIADFTASNCIGTHVGYSVIMDKPHSFIRQKIEMTANDVEKEFLKKYLERRHRMMEAAERIFAGTHTRVTAEQSRFIDKCYGVHSTVSQTEMLRILEECNAADRRYP